MTPVQHSGLRLPQQDLEGSSLFECNPKAVSEWVENLPLGNPQRAGSAVRTAISELNRIELSPARRFQLLELLRTPTFSVITALTRNCLNQPIVLDDETQLRADLITDLSALSAAGNTLVAVQTIQSDVSGDGGNPAKLACESLHRAVTQTGERILLAYLLYQPIELNVWATLHQLYALTERQQLARLPVEDAIRGTRSSVAQEYLAPLLLACSKPNQLRQHDIKGAFRAFQEWRDKAELEDPELGDGLFAVDLQSDQPPAFAELLVRRGAAHFRYINTQALIKHFEDLKLTRGDQGLRVIEFDRETRLDTNLLEHLIKSLGEVSQRNFTRQPSRQALYIAAGLSNVHYYVAGERLLEEVFRSGLSNVDTSSNRNPFLTPLDHGDKWQKANPEDEIDTHEHEAESAVAVELDAATRAAIEAQDATITPIRHLVHSVKTTNTSPGGYCVEWTEPPDAIHIGDLVCVRDTVMEDADWTIAVIRWVSQVKHAPTLLGLELVSPRASAYAAQIKMPSGDFSKPIRVLLLPEIPLVGQSNTMVVPRMVLKEGQRITLTRQEDAFLVKLKRQVASTGYFSQMDFEYIRQLDDDIANSSTESTTIAAFHSVWNEI